MGYSKRDRDNMTVHSLIGYARSASIIHSPTIKKRELKHWADGLIEIADILAEKLDEPTRDRATDENS